MARHFLCRCAGLTLTRPRRFFLCVGLLALSQWDTASAGSGAENFLVIFSGAWLLAVGALQLLVGRRMRREMEVRVTHPSRHAARDGGAALALP